MIFRALREGVEVFASKARSSPTPLRSGFWAAGSVSPIYTKCASLYYSDVVVGAPRHRASGR